MGFRCTWVHNANELIVGGVCFYLSYGKIVGEEVLAKFKHNLVVHESDLPKGKGWSPLTWQILEGKNTIPVTLFEADVKVDSGVIYAQEWLEFDGTELIDELRQAQAEATIRLCREFVANYPQSTTLGKQQIGEETFYRRRTPKDSELDLNKTLAEQINLLRVVDNTNYPAYFVYKDTVYYLQVCKRDE